MKKRIVYDAKKCVSCYACMIACLDQNDIDVEHGEEPYRKVFNEEFQEAGQNKFVFLSTACMHCDDAPCIVACPVGCIKKDLETGMTIYDNTDCIGCKSCGMACPFGAPRYRSDGKMEKCDGCYMRIKNSMEPACVRACAFGALELMTEDEIRANDDKKAINTMLKTIL